MFVALVPGIPRSGSHALQQVTPDTGAPLSQHAVPAAAHAGVVVDVVEAVVVDVVVGVVVVASVVAHTSSTLCDDNTENLIGPHTTVTLDNRQLGLAVVAGCYE